MNEEENLNKVFKKIGRADLVIKRVPAPTLSAFKEFAKKECADDYGMALKYLMDTVFGWVPAKIQELEERLNSLEAKPTEDRLLKVIRTNAGKINIEEVKSDE